MELTIAGFELDRRRIVAAIGVVLGCVALTLFYRQVDVPALHREARELNGAWVFVLMTILPLVGFPVSVCHAVAGVRFGLPLGFALVAVSIVIQLLIAYGLVRTAPGFFARKLEPLRKRLPEAAHVPLTQCVLLLPGAPYFAQLYLLPLVGVPLRVYFLWGLPIHVARSIVGIVFGEMSDQLTPLRMAGFVAYFVVMSFACGWAFHRLHARMKDQRSTAGGRTRRASGRSAERARARSRAPSK